MNCTSPRIELLFPAEDRPRKPAAAALASLEDAPASRKMWWGLQPFGESTSGHLTVYQCPSVS